MIQSIILILSIIGSFLGLIFFSRLENKTAYDLRTFKFGLFLYFVVLIFDIVNNLSIKFPGLKAALESIQLPADYLVLSSKLALLPLIAVIFFVGVLRIHQERSEDSFKAEMEKL
ncbi:hypothetical protein HY498_01900 [Candidatus Woesearchaeota archaeon]|nr:hypothetical protein [Candidatus Woesearchaeota archaeon]